MKVNSDISYPRFRQGLIRFIAQYVTPQINSNSVIWGNQNNTTLPPFDNDYIIVWLTNAIRHGTNIKTYDTEELKESTLELSEIVVQIDCYANSNNGQDGINAMLRAKSLEMLFRDPIATDFLKDYNMSALYSEDIRDTTLQGDSNTMLHRWTVTVHLNTNIVYTMDRDSFEAVHINHIKNI